MEHGPSLFNFSLPLLFFFFFFILSFLVRMQPVGPVMVHLAFAPEPSLQDAAAAAPSQDLSLVDTPQQLQIPLEGPATSSHIASALSASDKKEEPKLPVVRVLTSCCLLFLKSNGSFPSFLFVQLPETKYVKYVSGKLVLNEARISLRWLPSTTLELAAFHTFCENATAANWKDGLPVQFIPLLAKLVQESNVTLAEITNEVLEILFPFHQDSSPDLLPEGLLDFPLFCLSQSDHFEFSWKITTTTTTETAAFVHAKPLSYYSLLKAIPALAKRENYGVAEEVTTHKMPVWRWEVQDLALFPKELANLIDVRRVRRIEARKEAALIVSAFATFFSFPPKIPKDGTCARSL